MRRLIVCLAGLLALCSLTTAAAPGETPAAYSFGVAPQFDQRKLFATWKPVLDALSKATGEPFRFLSASSVPEFEQAVAKGSYDFIYVNPYHLYRERLRQGYMPLVRDVTPLRGVVAVRSDSAIRELTDLDGKSLAVPSPNAIGASMLIRADAAKEVVERPISFLASELGSLKVLIDFSELHARDRAHHAEMGMILGLVTLLLILTLGVALELNVGRPVHTLVLASRELARGNYAANLPPQRRDEVGALVGTFAAMRTELREHHDSLLLEIDARDRAQLEQVRLNAALADRERDLRAVTDAVTDAIVRVDELGRIGFWNPGAERLFGLTAAQAVGARMHEVLAPPRFRERARNEYELFLRSPAAARFSARPSNSKRGAPTARNFRSN